MNKMIASILTGAVLLAATSVFGQTGTTGQEKPEQAKPAQKGPAGTAPKPGSSSVVIRQSGSGNRAVVRQSASGTTTETVVSHGGTNSVEVSHDGRSSVVIEQREKAQQARPDTTKKKQ